MAKKIYGPYPAVVLSEHDGDTVLLDVDLGFGMHQVELNCRTFGDNAPELALQAGKDALAFAQTLLKPGDRVLVTSHSWDKYGGRFDGDITLSDGRDFVTEMIAAGHAVAVKY